MNEIGAFSYGAGAVASVALALVLAVGWRGGLAGALMLVAAITNAVWSGLFAYDAWHGVGYPLALELAEVLRYGAWFAFLLAVTVPARPRALATGLVVSAAGLCVLQVFFVGIDISLASSAGQSAGGAGWSLIGAVALPILGLVLVEQLFRGSGSRSRWGLKYLCIGLGGLFVYDLFVFSEALLLKRIDIDLWYARGSINALVMPLIAVSAARNPAWSLDVYVSRRAVLHSASLVGAGAYLLAMAAAGYYIKMYGGSWGGALQVTFFFGAFVLLAVLLFSAHVRARTRVFFSKHFFNYKYDYRDEWLRFTETLDGGPEDTPLAARVLQAIGQLVDSQGGALWQLRNGRFEPTCTWNLTLRDSESVTERQDGPLATLLGERRWVVSRDEWQAYPERYGQELGSHWLADMSEAWVVVPLTYRDNLRGFVVLKAPQADIDLNWEDRDLLRTAGRQAASYLAQEEAAEALGQAQQLEAFSKLSAFVVHDLKNVINQLSLVMGNAERHKHKPGFLDDVLRTIANALNRMDQLMEQLRRGSKSERWETVDVVAMLYRIAEGAGDSRPSPTVSAPVPQLPMHIDAGRFEAVLEHLVQNAKEATGADGRIELNLQLTRDSVLVEVSDTGSGMSADFVRERLFKPFDSTKGSKGMGIGVFEAREIVTAMDGTIDVFTRPGEGTRMQIRLPQRLVVARKGSVTSEMRQ